MNAIKRGEDDSKKKLSQLAFSGAVDEETIESLHEQAENGDAEAMWRFGLCKDLGIGTKQDKKEAESLYQSSSESRNPIGVILATSENERKKGEEEECDDNNGAGEDEYEDDWDEEENEYDYDERYDDYADGVLDRLKSIAHAKDGVGWY